jgi:predicted nucleotide-binding protein
MAKRSLPAVEPQRAVLTVEQMKRGIVRFQKRIDELQAFDPTSVQKRWAPEVSILEKAIDETLVAVFGSNTIEYNRYRSATNLDRGPVIMGREFAPREVQQFLAEGKQRAILTLQQAIRGLEEEIEEQETLVKPVNAKVESERDLTKVFIVHGHDEGAREAVARFLERLGLKPIILHEQANQGRTVIEKVENHGNVSFAIVLLTPDDEGGKKGEVLKPRARQNVLLELGYFIGRLGRKHVCALKRGELDIPSDFAGVIAEAFDDGGGWKQKLAAELDAAGFPIDWNKVMRP